MEDQDQALAAMTEYTEGDAKGDDSAQSRCAIKAPEKRTAIESMSTSTAAQGKRKRGKGSGGISRAEELGDSEAQPGPKKKKARLARSSEEILLPAREELEVGSTSMNDDGDGSKTKSKGSSSKPLRYILFIGNVLSLQYHPSLRHDH